MLAAFRHAGCFLIREQQRSIEGARCESLRD
jgi:hypothetical protein